MFHDLHIFVTYRFLAPLLYDSPIYMLASKQASNDKKNSLFPAIFYILFVSWRFATQSQDIWLTRSYLSQDKDIWLRGWIFKI